MEIDLSKYPLVLNDPLATKWLNIQARMGLSPNTIKTYGYAMERYLGFCTEANLDPYTAPREDVLKYIEHLRLSKNKRHARVIHLDSGSQLASATIQQWLTVTRLFFDYLVEDNVRPKNPLGRRDARNQGKYRSLRSGSPAAMRRFERLPWIPNGQQWGRIVTAASRDVVRNRLMLSLAYDCALRRGELCSLQIGDIDPGERLIRVRAEVAKNRRERIIPFSDNSSKLLRSYLRQRREVSRDGGALLRSESPRNYGCGLGEESWSKITRSVAIASEVDQLHTHSYRHLALTDLARAGWDIHEIATFAGHRTLETTMRYIHLSGVNLRDKLEQGMRDIHDWRAERLRELV